jgi:hypothetical protein
MGPKLPVETILRPFLSTKIKGMFKLNKRGIFLHIEMIWASVGGLGISTVTIHDWKRSGWAYIGIWLAWTDGLDRFDVKDNALAHLDTVGILAIQVELHWSRNILQSQHPEQAFSMIFSTADIAPGFTVLPNGSRNLHVEKLAAYIQTQIHITSCSKFASSWEHMWEVDGMRQNVVLDLLTLSLSTIILRL